MTVATLAALHWASTQHFVMGAAAGWASAARVDWEAFQHWQSFNDAATYGWSMAAWRWLKGAVIGGVTVSSLGGLLQ